MVNKEVTESINLVSIRSVGSSEIINYFCTQMCKKRKEKLEAPTL